MNYTSNKLQNPPLRYESGSRFFYQEVAAILGFMLFFITSFYIFKSQTYLVVPNRHQLQWATHLTFMLHSAMILGLIALFLNNAITKHQWVYWLNMTRGYFLGTLVIHLLYPTTSPSILVDIIHHSFAAAISLYAYKYPRLVAIGFLCEVTQIPLYTTWYLIKWNLSTSWAFSISSGVTLLSFLVFRVFLFTYLLFAIWKKHKENSRRTSFKEVMLLVPIVLLNYYWFGLLIKKAYQQLC